MVRPFRLLVKHRLVSYRRHKFDFLENCSERDNLAFLAVTPLSRDLPQAERLPAPMTSRDAPRTPPAGALRVADATPTSSMFASRSSRGSDGSATDRCGSATNRSGSAANRGATTERKGRGSPTGGKPDFIGDAISNARSKGGKSSNKTAGAVSGRSPTAPVSTQRATQASKGRSDFKAEQIGVEVSVRLALRFPCPSCPRATADVLFTLPLLLAPSDGRHLFEPRAFG